MNLPGTLTSVGKDFEPESVNTQDDLTRRMKHFNKLLEYLLELRDAHCYNQQSRDVSKPIEESDVVIIHDDSQPHGQ